MMDYNFRDHVEKSRGFDIPKSAGTLPYRSISRIFFLSPTPFVKIKILLECFFCLFKGRSAFVPVDALSLHRVNHFFTFIGSLLFIFVPLYLSAQFTFKLITYEQQICSPFILFSAKRPVGFLIRFTSREELTRGEMRCRDESFKRINYRDISFIES